MSILWCGGEDIDFMDTGTVQVQTNTSYFRSAYARCAIMGASTGLYRFSKAFPGGAVTSCWLSFQMEAQDNAAAGNAVGLVASTVGTGERGLWIGIDNGNPAKVTLTKFDGTSTTTLATTAATYYTTSVSIHRFDVQLISYGGSATVNVYIDNGLALTYSGSVTVTGVTAVDAVGLGRTFGTSVWASEIIVADFDTRSLSLMTMAPTGTGTTDSWTGAATDINETTTSDATVLTTNTSAQNEQFNVTDLAAGTYAVLAVKVAARAALAAGSTPTGIKLGVNSGGTVAVGSTITPGISLALAETLFSTNPATSAAWAQSDMNALQLNLQSV